MAIENVNGIQVDVGAVIGDKIAEMAVATIPPERLQELGKKALEDVMFTAKKSGYFSDTTEPSKANRLATDLYYKEVQKYFAEIVASEEYQKKAREEAEQILAEMREKIHNQCVDQLTQQLSGMYITGLGSAAFQQSVESIVTHILNSTRRY